MLTWTSVVTTALSDNDIAAAVASRNALEIRPLIEFAPLRRAMGLPSMDALPGHANVPAATVASTGRRRSSGRATNPVSKQKTAKQRSAATTAAVRTPDTAAA